MILNVQCKVGEFVIRYNWGAGRHLVVKVGRGITIHT